MTTTNEGPTTMKEEKEEEEELIRTESKRRNSEFMPRRSIWKGSFFDAFLLRMQKKRDLLLNRKIWSRRSSISPEFVDCSVRIYNGKTPVRCKITEGKIESDKPPDAFPFRDSDSERESVHSSESEEEPRGHELRLAPPGGGSGEPVPRSLAENEAAHPAQPLTARERESASCSNSQAAGPSAAVLHQLPLLVPDPDPVSQTGFGSTKSMRQKMQTKFFKEKPISL
ncbi:hypothetical protein NE237_007475 [Protea cynaroides]|uniref:Uncharacterized protein n=1 Tax=Protea cynaroides TaxID=273540 RepID=A0A9Q0KQB9_9MAGN|nr:hypothetical protein NE237_007475 [Protea cynaroides]